MEKIIDVTIERKENEAILNFGFEEKMSLSLTSDSQDELKDFFIKLLKKIVDDKENIYKLNFSDEGQTDLFHDVGDKYIKNLDNELSSIYVEINKLPR
ncbi:MAG: hypothetical protein MJ225_03135 [Bacilli bacterium]|nr:hypothetical protein [Bacilli bacterium]